MSPPRTVIIVGSGIVGLSAAFYLQRAGFRCTLIDAKGPGQETSFGNAGSISIGTILPHARVSMLLRALLMLATKLAPLKINWRRLATLAPWLASFIYAARPAQVARSTAALAALNAQGRKCWLELAETIGARELVRGSGFLQVYSSAKTFARDAHERAQMRKHGVAFRELNRAGIVELEPQLGEQFTQGVLQTDALAVTDPGAFCLHLADYLKKNNAQFIHAKVSQIIPDLPTGKITVFSDRGRHEAEHLVLAAGIWSKDLLRPLGINLPLQTGRGYHLMFATEQPLLSRPVLWIERYMLLSPLSSGTRMTSVKELTPLETAVNFSFIRRLVNEAQKVLPALPHQHESEWMGNRPCLPDSVPIIDYLNADNCVVACGHGHLGMTQGPITGKLVAQMLNKEPPDIELKPYGLARFNR